MVIVVIRQLPRITNAQLAGRADLEVDARFDNRAVLGNRHALGAERGAAVDEAQVGVRLGIAKGMPPTDGRARVNCPPSARVMTLPARRPRVEKVMS